jgi:hypothetical protein
MIGTEDHLVVGNGDRQGITGVHQADSEVDEVEVVEAEEVIEKVVVMVEGAGHHLEVLRLKVLFLWKRGRLSIHSGIFDPCNSRVLGPWPLK